MTRIPAGVDTNGPSHQTSKRTISRSSSPELPFVGSSISRFSICITSYCRWRLGPPDSQLLRYNGLLIPEESTETGSIPTLEGFAEKVKKAYPEAASTGRLAIPGWVIEQLHRLRAGPEETPEAASVSARAGSRERGFLRRAAAIAGLSGEEAFLQLMAAGAAARRLGVTPERLRSLAEAGEVPSIRTRGGRVYRAEDLDQLESKGWSGRQAVVKRCSSVGCSAIAVDTWSYVVVPGVVIGICLCARHTAQVLGPQE
ncbi:MAG: hypothetical protein QOE83_38 [Actinomycetota bacterium]|nr:hypothetical protein [Actinomycetota bacterium]